MVPASGVEKRKERRRSEEKDLEELDSDDDTLLGFFSFSGLDAHVSKRVELSFRGVTSRRDVFDFLLRLSRRRSSGAIVRELEGMQSIDHVAGRGLVRKQRAGVQVLRRMG